MKATANTQCMGIEIPDIERFQSILICHDKATSVGTVHFENAIRDREPVFVELGNNLAI
jgi:hypothetical protein